MYRYFQVIVKTVAVINDQSLMKYKGNKIANNMRNVMNENT